MIYRKNFLAVGIMTNGDATLRLALSGLGRLRKNFTVIINNTGNTKLTRRDVRRMGYAGHAHIINGGTDSCTPIIDKIAQMRRPPQWTTLINDTDILINTDIPDIPAHNFAVIGNRIEVCGGLAQLMRALNNPCDLALDGKNVVMHHGARDIRGIFFRTRHVIAARAHCAHDADILSAIQIANPDSAPIYMDAANIIEINPDFGARRRHHNLKKSTI